MDDKINTLNILKLWFICAIFSISVGCDEKESGIIPSVPVNLELDLNNDLADLGVGTIVTITPDSVNTYFSVIDYHNNLGRIKIPQKTYGNGILVYRKEFDVYQAFDLTCTYRAFDDYCAVKVGSGNKIICPCCQSEFIAELDCRPTNVSKAPRGLKSYNAIVVGNGASLVISK